MRFITGFALTALMTLAGLTSSAEPCCMVPRGYKGSISQSAQEAILFYDQGREDLILKINYKISGEKMPDRFAWVITVPNEPDEYAVADPALFQEVHDWAMLLVKPPPPPSRGYGMAPTAKAAPEGLEFGRAVKVGPYDIQPVRALGREALAGLNEWLSSNGFPTEEPKHMEYFVDEKFTFLCVKVGPPEGKKAVDPAADLVPLHLSFRADQPYYPLRFSLRQGVFDVSLTLFTKDHFDYRASGETLRRLNWVDRNYLENVPVFSADFPATLKKAYEKSVFKDDRGRWHVNVLYARGVNQGNSIATWKTDIFFATIQPPPGSSMWILLALGAAVILLAGAFFMRRKTARA